MKGTPNRKRNGNMPQVSITSDHTLKSRMMGNYHVRFGSGGGESDLLTDPQPVRKGLQQQYLACRLLYTRFEGRDPDAPIYSLSRGARGQDVDMLMLGHWKELLDLLAPYGMSEQGGWCPVPPERRDWLSHTQQQEDAMAAQSADAMEPHRIPYRKAQG